ncbi:DNA repair protein RecN [Beijerinckia sp. L45]|uniref:DNA repair protein RecN n=1 Tax=Beijerinckia sp. L45 TaxID=1641855 RepID=UPI00131AB069|nr:DNA repair protein RecN [Beijerinckia sp. L45]
MLVQLSIRDIVLIDRLDLDLGRGMTVLTGETGAGKSILLDAFSLALGARGDGTLVRQGFPQGQVTAVFDIDADHPARQAAQAQDIDADGDLILRRVQMADGRTRAFVNDQPVSVQTLKALGKTLVEIHGQHDDRALVEPAVHRQLVDAFGALTAPLEAVRAAHAKVRALETERKSEETRVAAIRAEADFLRHAYAELTKLAVEAGEEVSLTNRRQTMMAAEKVVADLRDAQEVVGGDGPVSALNGALRRLDRRQAQAPALIGPSVQALDAALAALDVARETLEQALRDAEFDPRELERIEERLFAIRAAARKYAVTADALPALAESHAATLEKLDADEAELVTLAGALVQAEAAYNKAAATLSAARKKAATALDAAVNAELPPLKLERARFITQVEPEAPGPDGIDAVGFWVETNPGTRPGPLMKIASGGELARFMLALKVALANKGSAPTLVFDEIDTGVGGAVADAMGARLARLASRVQVLAVTHAPQVAARAAGHFRIAKDATDEGRRVATRVTTLAPEARQEEIARMLAGATVTDEARAAAGRLLAETE